MVGKAWNSHDELLECDWRRKRRIKWTYSTIKEESEKTREVMKGKIVEDVEWVKEEIVGTKATLGKVKEKVGID